MQTCIKAPPGVTSLSVDPHNPVALWGTSLWGLFSINTISLEFAVPIFALDVFKAFEASLDHTEQIAYATAADSYRSALVDYVAGNQSQTETLTKYVNVLYSVFDSQSPIIRLPKLDIQHWCHHIYHTGDAITLVSNSIGILINLASTKSITVFPLPPSQYEVLSCCPVKHGILIAYSNCTLHFLSDTESDVVFLKKTELEARRTVGAPPTGLLSPFSDVVVTHIFEDELFVCRVFT